MSTQVVEHRNPSGDAGSRATLVKMRGIVDDALRMPIVVERAHAIARYVPARGYAEIAVAIRDWLGGAFKFVADPINVELVRTPEYMLRQYDTQLWISGDCDDVATLGAALGKSVGIPAKFIAVSFRKNGTFSHVFAVLYPRGGTPVSLDVTRPVGAVAQVQRRLVFPV